MNPAFEYLLEPFLVRFYLLESLCGSFISAQQRSRMFTELAGIFCLEDSRELREYERLSALPHFQAVEDLSSYGRLCRTIEFADLTDQHTDLTDRDRRILAQKRKAMTAKAELLPQGKNLTRETVASALTVKAENGSVDAMMALAYLEYHGIFGCADRENALRRARLCGRWNDLFGNLFCIAYDAEGRQPCYDTLATVLRSAGERPVLLHICAFTGHTGETARLPEARLMEKAFARDIVKRGTYDRAFAKAAFSRLIGMEDKEKLLLDPQRELLEALPLDLKEEGLHFDDSVAQRLALQREDELRRIAQNFAVAQQCPAQVYKPLLIIGTQDYPVRMYGDMIRRALGETPVVELDAGTLTDADFAGTVSNVFLRGLSQTRAADPVFLIRDCQELSDHYAEELLKVLDPAYRCRFKLFQPAVSLDLTKLRFVLLATGRTSGVRKLAAGCDALNVRRIAPEEKDAVIADVFCSCATAFGCAGLQLEAEARRYLSGFEIHQVQQLLDSAIRCAIFERKDVITLRALQQIDLECGATVVKREFGYTGGKCRA